MIDDWQEMNTAPKDQPVLVCPTNCEIVVAIQRETELNDPKTNKSYTGWRWRIFNAERREYGFNSVEPKMWRPCPLPPKHLYERKLAADLLQKQVEELRR